MAPAASNLEISVREQIMVAAAFFAAALGTFIRFWQLGSAPLAVDEYYFGQSVLNILERGVPQFACGGYYFRGVLQQYLSASIVYAGYGLEFATRFWPAVASLLSILAAWKITRLASGRTAACVAVILCSLSLWEIEFARFGRMYAPFQALVLWYLYFQILHLVYGRASAAWYCLCLSALGIFVYAGSALLLALNFLPVICAGKSWTKTHLVASSGLLVAGVLRQTTDFRRLGVPNDQLPPSPESATIGAMPIDLPFIHFESLVLILAGLLIASLILVAKRPRLKINHPAALYWAATATAFLIGTIALGIELLVAGLLLRLPRIAKLSNWGTSAVVASIAGLGIIWFVVEFGLHWTAGEPLRASIKAAVMHVINYPDIFYKVIQPWIHTIPITTAVLGVFVGYTAWKALRNIDENGRGYPVLKYLLAVSILLILLVGVLEQPYRTTRYTYFLYPVFLVIASIGIAKCVALFAKSSIPRGAAISMVIAAAVMYSEDFSLAHLTNINEPQYRFRTVYDGRLQSHYYARWDYRSVAEYVNSRLEQDDRVVVFDQPATYYLSRTDAVFLRYGTQIHRLTWSCGGSRHLWSNAPLIDTDTELLSLIDDTPGKVWLITRTDQAPWRDKLEEALIETNNLIPLISSIDGYLAVYRLGGVNNP